MAVQQFFYSVLSKQERKVRVAPVMINENETCHVIRISHTSMFLLTCSYNTSFLARLLIIMDGDVESNPGPNDIDFSIKEQDIPRVKGRPKKYGFKGRFTKKESSLVSSKLVNNFMEIDHDIDKCVDIKQDYSAVVNGPVGLINYSNDCFFNSVIQALISLQSFREHVRNFDDQNSHTQNSHKMDAASSIKDLFEKLEEMKAQSDGPLMTHDYIMALDLQGYIENEQFDAQECLSYIVDLFYPWVNDGNDSDNHGYPDDCLFLLDGEETTHCHKCDTYTNNYFREALCQVAFPEPDSESSIELEFQKVVNDPNGEVMDGDERYACEHCNPVKTVATRQRILMNAEKYIIIQFIWL